MGGGRGDLQNSWEVGGVPSPLSVPLDQHHVTQIEVFIVCMERLIFT
jgi:hypothetical protein